jgi:hypothetical protein
MKMPMTSCSVKCACLITPKITVKIQHVFESVSFSKPVLFMYTDDHQLTYTSSVQLSLTLKIDLDSLCAARMALYQKNPVEKIICHLNLGLQCVLLVCSIIDFII